MTDSISCARPAISEQNQPVATMARPSLLELAERLGAMRYPNRSIEMEIASTLGWRKHPNPTAMGGLIDAWFTPEGEQVRWAVPLYTASLDAALTLVPEGWSVVLSVMCDGSTATLEDDRVHPVRLETVDGEAPTPALALTAAALRARAAQEVHHD